MMVQGKTSRTTDASRELKRKKVLAATKKKTAEEGKIRGSISLLKERRHKQEEHYWVIRNKCEIKIEGKGGQRSSSQGERGKR